MLKWLIVIESLTRAMFIFFSTYTKCILFYSIPISILIFRHELQYYIISQKYNWHNNDTHIYMYTFYQFYTRYIEKDSGGIIVFITDYYTLESL